MKTIEITYRPVPFLRFRRTARGTHPETWAEITPVQLLTIVQTYTGKMSNIRFLAALTGLPRRILRRLDSYHQYKLLQLIGFVNETAPYSAFIIPRVKIKGKTLVPPKPMLKEMPFGQFIFADSFFHNWQETKNPEELARFLAALLTPAGEPFTAATIDRLTPLTAKLPPHLAEAYRLNYILVFEWLMERYPLVFPAELPEADSLTESGKEKKKPRDPRAWMKVFDSLVGDDIIHRDQYAGLSVHTVFTYFTRNIKEGMKRKKR